MPSPYLERIDAISPRKHFRLNDSQGATVATNRGLAPGHGAYRNNSGITYRLATLVQNNDDGRSVSLSGSVPNPPHITVPDLVTTASFTVDIAVQLDVHKSKHILFTTGGGTTDGEVSCEVQDAGNGLLRLRQWTVVDGAANAWVTDAGTVPVGEACKITLVQRSDVATGGRWIYVNGALVGSDISVREFAAPPPGTWCIGAWPSGADPLDGCIAEVASWDRDLSAAEVKTLATPASILQLPDWSETVVQNRSGVFAPDGINPSSGWTWEVVSDGALVKLQAGGPQLKWASSATDGAASVADSAKVRLLKGALASRTATIGITVVRSRVGPAPGLFEGLARTNGKLVDLGTTAETEASFILDEGGDARYDATRVVFRARCIGTRCGRNRTTWSNLFAFRIQGNHDGGCVCGGAFWSDVTRDQDWTTGDTGQQLYPCSDGGQVYFQEPCQNFLVEGFRIHGGWDPFRLGAKGNDGVQSTPLIKNITIKGNWVTLTRDDIIENDSYREGLVVEDNLFDGFYVGISQRSGSGTNWQHQHFTTMVRDNLFRLQAMRSTKKTPNIDGFGHGEFFKLRDGCPKFDLFDNIFHVSQKTHAGGGGNPFHSLMALDKLRNSSGNVVIWGGSGGYPFELPPGFTKMSGPAGSDLWENAVADWKTAHPLVRRFNIPGVIVD